MAAAENRFTQSVPVPSCSRVTNPASMKTAADTARIARKFAKKRRNAPHAP